MLLIRLACSYVAVHSFRWYSAGFVPKLFPSFEVTPTKMVEAGTKEASTSLRRRATARSFVPLPARQSTPQNSEVPAL
jgi:hypothetical protein